MAELLEAVVSWFSLLLALLVFGFAPGFCLRLIVLVYPHDDPRRAELIAELYAIPRMQRPVWVAEQLEVALFEGLVLRVSAALREVSGRGTMLWLRRLMLLPIVLPILMILTLIVVVCPRNTRQRTAAVAVFRRVRRVRR